MRYGIYAGLALLSACGTPPLQPFERPTAAVAPSVKGAPTDAARLAMALVGAPYRYGGAAPDGFDCSGLVWYVYRNAGVTMPRTAAEQRMAIRPVDIEHLEPGDLVFFQTPVDHVGIYVGDGDFVHAPSSGKTVERAKLRSPYFLLGFAGAGRPTQLGQ
jgi:murein DD-endopeptidase